jgi:peptide-methionine (S)-S-oxide reductase
MPDHIFMFSRPLADRFVLLAIASLGILSSTMLPMSAANIPATTVTKPQTAVFAGGCFWGVEAVFEHLKGVSEVVSGYSGGKPETAQYRTVSAGETGHAESVRVIYDPSKISYPQLLKIYFLVAHDPTQLDRQGPDFGTQYRSAIFYVNDEQKKAAQAYIIQLNKQHLFQQPIVTKLAPLNKFYQAEKYHQDFIAHHPYDPYVVFNDLPKLSQLQKKFPDLYKQ